MPDPKIPKNIFSPTLSLDDVDEEEIARQLTLIDFQLYDRIRVCLTKDHCLPSQVDVVFLLVSLLSFLTLIAEFKTSGIRIFEFGLETKLNEAQS